MIIDPRDVRRQMAETDRRVPRAELLGARLQDAADFITRCPSYYLAFGPYWWVFKEIVRRRIGTEKVVRWAGPHDDTDIRRRYQTGDDAYDLTACLLYQAEHSGNLADGPQRHDVADESGTDTVSYELNDPDVHRE